jgi:hypothetical protein
MNPDPNSIRILAVDDRPLFRQGIAALLTTQSGMNLIGKAASGKRRSRRSVPAAGESVPRWTTGGLAVMRSVLISLHFWRIVSAPRWRQLSL